MFCTNCGYKMGEEDEFCSSCGHAKKEETIRKNSKDRNLNVENQKKYNRKTKIFLSIPIIFSVIVIASVVFFHSVEKYGFKQSFGEQLNTSEQNLFPIYINDKFGYIDEDGEVVIEPKFYDFSDLTGRHNDDYDFHEGLSCVGIKEGENIKYGFINKKGEFAIKPIYDEARNFYNGLASVIIGSKKAFINKKGEIVFEHEFHRVDNFSEGLAYFEDSSLDKLPNYGFIDKKGEIKIKGLQRLATITKFEEDYLPLVANKFIDKNGNDHLGFKKDYVIYSNFSEGLALIKLGDKYGYIDKTGKIVIDPQFEEGRGFSEGLAAVKMNGKWGFINKNGLLVIPNSFNYVFDFSDGMAAFSNNEYEGIEHHTKDHKLGFINNEGKIVIKPEIPIELNFLTHGDSWLVSNMYRFRNGLAYVPMDGLKTNGSYTSRKYGYINKKGKCIWSENIKKDYTYTNQFNSESTIIYMNKYNEIIEEAKEPLNKCFNIYIEQDVEKFLKGIDLFGEFQNLRNTCEKYGVDYDEFIEEVKVILGISNQEVIDSANEYLSTVYFVPVNARGATTQIDFRPCSDNFVGTDREYIRVINLDDRGWVIYSPELIFEVYELLFNDFTNYEDFMIIDNDYIKDEDTPEFALKKLYKSIHDKDIELFIKLMDYKGEFNDLEELCENYHKDYEVFIKEGKQYLEDINMNFGEDWFSNMKYIIPHNGTTSILPVNINGYNNIHMMLNIKNKGWVLGISEKGDNFYDEIYDILEN
ncbi:WG repeat-containing protein [Anaeromicrobium sediminis]|uniref:Zinc-ribbon domain-containing protein n=1 Tax=Anaeromicrobium sediminis TaxID=1478221 RepID=A0A267MHC3_9FIRM|nr:WG repeat-containing protein [Anaeromicrobium sediminis]PAB58812.1 hypothetical protein CCE28_13020 [Anaeromicrobium sediminis]